MSGIKERVQTAEDWKVRAALIALCNDSHIYDKVNGLLKQLSEPTSSPDTVICVQCGVAFDEKQNTENLCRYHNGESLNQPLPYLTSIGSIDN